jgi:hypothetical protein
MALIRNFKQTPGKPVGWRSEVECGWTLGDHAGTRVVHLETYGSSERAIPGKVSQSLELDERAASELIAIFRKAFPGLR